MSQNTQYAIRVIPQYYAGSSNDPGPNWVEDIPGVLLRFATKTAAQEKIDEIRSYSAGRYDLNYNEYARPDYEIVPIKAR